MKDTRGAFLTKIGPFMVVLEGINRSNSQTPITILFSFYLLSTYSFLKVYCGTYTETLIVAQVEERERKKIKHEGERQHLDIHISTYM